MTVKDYRPLGCHECRHGDALGFDFSMAFQPIVDIEKGNVFAQEALVRGLNGEGAGSIFEHVNAGNLYRFDQTCRVKAIELAARLGCDSFLSINFMPNAVYKPELCIRTTLNAAERVNLPINKIIFEFTENERVVDSGHLHNVVNYYQKEGFCTAMDDFGAGYSGLNLFADIETDLIKLDMALIRDVDDSIRRQKIVASMLSLCKSLDVKVIAEGVETASEFRTLQRLGITLFQGYYFAKPQFEKLVVPSL